MISNHYIWKHNLKTPLKHWQDPKDSNLVYQTIEQCIDAYFDNFPTISKNN